MIGDDGANAFSENISNLIPSGKGLKLTAPQFSKLFKGNLSRLQPKMRGLINRILNKWVFDDPEEAVEVVTMGTAGILTGENENN